MLTSLPTSTIRVFLVDDQSLICQALQTMLSLESGLEVIGVANNGEQAIAQIEALMPDVVLMDIRMPVMDGMTATRVINQRFPNVKVLVLSTFDDDEYIAESIKAGAKGYLLKDMPSEELAQSIRLIHQGYTHMGPGLMDKLMDRISHNPTGLPESAREALNRLSKREKEVLQAVAQGQTNRDIANALYISEGTVKTHVTHLLSRLELRNRAQLAVYANSLPRGWLENRQFT